MYERMMKLLWSIWTEEEMIKPSTMEVVKVSLTGTILPGTSATPSFSLIKAMSSGPAN